MIEETRAEHPEVSLKDLCELFSVSRSWYYERPPPEEKAHRGVELTDAIERIVLEFPGYGYRRVSAELRRRGWVVNHKRVLRIMREESLLCQLQRRFKLTTNSAHSFKRYPNLLKDVELDGLDQGWISDITYVRLPTTFCYLAAILDAYSRVCVGWCLSRWIDTRLTLRALEMALAARQAAPGLCDPPFRPGRAVRLKRVRPPAAGGRRPHQHGKCSQPVRERQSGKFLPHSEDGGGLPERLPGL